MGEDVIEYINEYRFSILLSGKLPSFRRSNTKTIKVGEDSFFIS